MDALTLLSYGLVGFLMAPVLVLVLASLHKETRHGQPLRGILWFGVAMLALCAVIILFTIIGTMDIPLFDKIKPFLFTTHMIIWKSFFDNPLPTSQIWQSMIIMVLHIAGFTGLALYHFNRKDILS